MADVKLPRLYAIVDTYTKAHGSSHSWVAERMGMGRAALSAWWNEGLTSMPVPYQLNLLAKATRTPYRDVLDAALHDFGYLPESGLDALDPPARMNRKGQSVGRAQAKQQDSEMTAAQEEGPEFGA